MRFWKQGIIAIFIVLVITALMSVAVAGSDSTQDEIIYGDAIYCNPVAYMSVTGSVQGPIEGSVDLPGFSGMIALCALDHLVDIPFNQRSGVPIGNPRHYPLKVSKVVDRSSVKLYQALITGETLLDVTIRCYRVVLYSPIEEQYFTIKLTDARIVSIGDSAPNKFESEEVVSMPLEEISFVYRNISWKWEPESLECDDDWRSLRGGR